MYVEMGNRLEFVTRVTAALLICYLTETVCTQPDATTSGTSKWNEMRPTSEAGRAPTTLQPEPQPTTERLSSIIHPSYAITSPSPETQISLLTLSSSALSFLPANPTWSTTIPPESTTKTKTKVIIAKPASPGTSPGTESDPTTATTATASTDQNVRSTSGNGSSISVPTSSSSYFVTPTMKTITSGTTSTATVNIGNTTTLWPVKHASVVEGDVILGGLMMVHSREDSITCGPIMPQGGIQALEAMLYTLDQVNKHQLLPNITLGAHILDDCDKDTYGLEMAVDFIKGER